MKIHGNKFKDCTLNIKGTSGWVEVAIKAKVVTKEHLDVICSFATHLTLTDCKIPFGYEFQDGFHASMENCETYK